jgi:hypothetical protein
VLLGEDVRVVDVLGVVRTLDGQAELPAAGQLLSVGHQLGPGGRRTRDAGVLEHLLVVVEAVGQGVERHGRRRLARGAGGTQRGGDEAVLTADRGERLVVEGQQRAGRLEGGGPGVADVEHVGALAGGGGGEDPVQQVRPSDDLELDVDAGLLLELGQLGRELLLVVIKALALVARPVGERLGILVPTVAGCGPATTAGGGGDEGDGCDRSGDRGPAHDQWPSGARPGSLI